MFITGSTCWPILNIIMLKFDLTFPSGSRGKAPGGVYLAKPPEADKMLLMKNLISVEHSIV